MNTKQDDVTTSQIFSPLSLVEYVGRDVFFFLPSLASALGLPEPTQTL